jgi:hypothetical protein
VKISTTQNERKNYHKVKRKLNYKCNVSWVWFLSDFLLLDGQEIELFDQSEDKWGTS